MSFDPEESSELPVVTDEKQLCTSCVFPNEPASNFCAKCGAPLSSYAATGPFEHLFAEGHTYREAVERPRSFIVVLGIWLIFGAGAVVGAALVVAGLKSDFVLIVIGFFPLVISLVIIWRTTWNYLSRKQVDEKNDGE